MYQNSRCHSLFKDGAEGGAYYLDAIVWQGEEEYNTFTGRVEEFHSRNYVKKFPFTPKTFYVDVVKEVLPEDWTEEPFIEWDYYDTAEYEATGVKNWKKEKYRYKIKDRSQLEEVFKYYDKYE